MSSSLQLTIVTLMSAIMNTKIFHWNTTCYATHQSTGILADDLFEKMDTLVEQMLGKCEKNILENFNQQITISVSTFQIALVNLQKVLNSLTNSEFAKYTDILNTRDDILSSISKFQYLTRFDC